MKVTRDERLKQDGAIDPILFYSAADPWGQFSSFSPHGVLLPDPWKPGIQLRLYRSGEHRYQAMKAVREEDHDFVADADGPALSKQYGNSIQLRDDWGNDRNGYCYLAMVEVVTAKLWQHEDVFETLALTEDKWIYEDSPRDDIWGWRKYGNYNGKNLLGLAWMQVRDTQLKYL